ncbi:hypothetical protein SH580_21325 [Coraliomargarita algicola]|uniref:Uncharacterized protein n=1 Tax=Coraliomargarita algicola TaxID=3092156 RepID=A0ABZ0RLE0_9BACT|nr:hypothetical protein [Coraliomargarita sp. J2-16]WPJ95961.1 hypothetical protein SH580_21325 [Coraliomargarita sp. J2-16]
MILRDYLLTGLFMASMSLISADLYASTVGPDSNQGNQSASVSTLAQAQAFSGEKKDFKGYDRYQIQTEQGSFQ